MGAGIISIRHVSPETVVLTILFLLLLLRVARRPRVKRRHSRFYDLYMNSWLWHLRRWLWYVCSNRRCEGCHCRVALHRKGIRYRLGAPVVTVHHKNYRRLGHERRSDVALLCWPCHRARDSWKHRRR